MSKKSIVTTMLKIGSVKDPFIQKTEERTNRLFFAIFPRKRSLCILLKRKPNVSLTEWFFVMLCCMHVSKFPKVYISLFNFH